MLVEALPSLERVLEWALPTKGDNSKQHKQHKQQQQEEEEERVKVLLKGRDEGR